jgi:hypothetical protein
VYTQLTKVKGSPTTFTVERLRTDAVAEAGLLSKKRATDASAPDAQVDPLLYFHPPKALAERLQETLETTITDLERLTPEELYRRFRPGEMMGNTVDAKIGVDMHDTYKKYAIASEELHVLNREGGGQPDSDVANTQLLADLKRDSPRGRRHGQETSRKYRKLFNRDTVISLYDVKLYEGRIAALNDSIAKAWDQYEPTWRKELATKKAADRAKKAATARTKTAQFETTQKQAPRKRTAQKQSDQTGGTSKKRKKS